MEREYAKGLRRLVAKYQQKPSKVETETFDESTMFAKVLMEIGYIAGQHEIVADTLISNMAKVCEYIKFYILCLQVKHDLFKL